MIHDQPKFNLIEERQNAKVDLTPICKLTSEIFLLNVLVEIFQIFRQTKLQRGECIALQDAVSLCL